MAKMRLRASATEGAVAGVAGEVLVGDLHDFGFDLADLARRARRRERSPARSLER